MLATYHLPYIVEQKTLRVQRSNMRRLTIFLISIILTGQGIAQSPHGDGLVIDCAACHTSDSWDIPMEKWSLSLLGDQDSISNQFSHSTTLFPLEGQHQNINCRECHESLVFSEAQTECISCHTDMHRMTVGSDCARCHSTDHWLVDFIPELHDQNGFPLLGMHAIVSCDECHVSESELEFHRIGNDCINCHLDDYQATTSPNHQEAGYSTECSECHLIDGFGWGGGNINHSFFPLEKGHDIADCLECHNTGSYAGLSPECFTCHQDDYEQTQNPDHQDLGFGTDCNACHTLDPGWMPAEFDHDGMYFPIFSGNHNGEWNDCIECHTNPNDYSQFSCIDCHEHNDPNDLADEHEDENDYSYSSQACYSCHPDGSE